MLSLVFFLSIQICDKFLESQVEFSLKTSQTCLALSEKYHKLHITHGRLPLICSELRWAFGAGASYWEYTVIIGAVMRRVQLHTNASQMAIMIYQIMNQNSEKANSVWHITQIALQCFIMVVRAAYANTLI